MRKLGREWEGEVGMVSTEVSITKEKEVKREKVALSVAREALSFTNPTRYSAGERITDWRDFLL